MENTPTVNPARRLLDENAAADFLSVSARTLQMWRRNGRGPAFVKLGGTAVRYDVRTLESFIAKSIRRNTSEAA